MSKLQYQAYVEHLPRSTEPGTWATYVKLRQTLVLVYMYVAAVLKFTWPVPTVLILRVLVAVHTVRPEDTCVNST